MDTLYNHAEYILPFLSKTGFEVKRTGRFSGPDTEVTSPIAWKFGTVTYVSNGRVPMRLTGSVEQPIELLSGLS